MSGPPPAAPTAGDADERLWTAEETANYLGITVNTLYWLRHRNAGPPAFKVGKNLRFFPTSVRAWVLARPA
ncbi:hypothetical protein Back2_00440 [Nocardioides baekrokdamisoli]|uniref:Helix-turn-helix domain-containing protein n=1 Tax=Nocardioides baekrokdamisoli TaxID=1804624 RepID=A0A3G9IAJ0_9ACTN|nr:helix-turn-helix domain-containing protein [Nocardioides baekrokdamisoli]BBH15757.1 hypothetical protein Back2_00440 [Nocardioides baekrokdamisoli]